MGGGDDIREGLPPISSDQEWGGLPQRRQPFLQVKSQGRGESKAPRIGWDLDPNGLQPSKIL